MLDYRHVVFPEPCEHPFLRRSLSMKRRLTEIESAIMREKRDPDRKDGRGLPNLGFGIGVHPDVTDGPAGVRFV